MLKNEGTSSDSSAQLTMMVCLHLVWVSSGLLVAVGAISRIEPATTCAGHSATVVRVRVEGTRTGKNKKIEGKKNTFNPYNNMPFKLNSLTQILTQDGGIIVSLARNLVGPRVRSTAGRGSNLRASNTPLLGIPRRKAAVPGERETLTESGVGSYKSTTSDFVFGSQLNFQFYFVGRGEIHCKTKASVVEGSISISLGFGFLRFFITSSSRCSWGESCHILPKMEPPSDDIDTMEWCGDPSGGGVEAIAAPATASTKAFSVIDPPGDAGVATAIVKKQTPQAAAAAAAAGAAAASAAAATTSSPKISDSSGGKRGPFFSRASVADLARRTGTAEGGPGGGRGRVPDKEGMEGGSGGEGAARSSKQKDGDNNSNSNKAGGAGQGGAEFMCNECGLGFGSVPELQLHMARKTAWSNQGLVGCRVSCLVDNREWHEGLVTQVCCVMILIYFWFL